MNQLVPSVRRKPPSRSTPFQPSHELQYGVRVAARNVTGAVCSVQCQFCRYFGREEPPGSKRKRTQTIKLYTKPYRPEYFKDHNLSAHSQKWLEYEALNDQGTLPAFFTALPTRSNQVLAYYEGESNGLCFTFPEAIVDEFIAKAFFDGDLEEECIPTALRAFDQARDGYYDVIIKTPLRFSLAVQHLSVGLSFRQTAEIIQQHYTATSNPKLYGMTKNLAGTYARILVARSFQPIAKLMANPRMWGFAFASDCTTHMDRSFMDQRIRLAVDGVLVNLHLLAIPMFDRHTVAIQTNLITTVLNVLSPCWREKLIGIASDGENTMTGEWSGVITRLEAQARFPVLRVWCAAHQIDLVMKSSYGHIDNGDFVKVTKDLIVHLRRQKNLIKDIGSAAKKLTTRWMYMDNALGWILEHKVQLARHFSKNSTAKPTSSWWVSAAGTFAVATLVNVTFGNVQARDIILSQQMAQIGILVGSLQRLADVLKTPTADDQPDEHDIATAKWWIKECHLNEVVEDQGSFAIAHLKALSLEEKHAVLASLGRFILHVIDGMEKVQAERDRSNLPAEGLAPAVMPRDLAPPTDICFYGSRYQTQAAFTILGRRRY